MVDVEAAAKHAGRIYGGNHETRDDVCRDQHVNRLGRGGGIERRRHRIDRHEPSVRQRETGG